MFKFAENPNACYVCGSTENLAQADEDVFLCDPCDIKHAKLVFEDGADWRGSIETMRDEFTVSLDTTHKRN